MKLSEHVATALNSPQFFRKPFLLGEGESAWSCACDEMALVAVRAKLKLPAYRGPEEDMEAMLAWLAAEPVEPQTLGVAELLDWTGPADGQERKGIMLGVQIDRSRLAKLVTGLKGELTIWNSEEVVGIPSLLLARSGVWRAVLAGYDEAEEGAPRLGTQAELFDLAMALD